MNDLQTLSAACPAVDHSAPVVLTRRDLLLASAVTAAGAAMVSFADPAHANAPGAPGAPGASNAALRPGAPSVVLPPLPYDLAALSPVLSADAMGVHYGKHHKAYVDNLAKMVAGTPQEGWPLTSIIRTSAGVSRNTPMFNNAAQAWNHTFFWGSMSPKGGGLPPKRVVDAINATYGSLATFREQFVTRATSLFGSGWLWLMWLPQSKTIGMRETFNADTLADSQMFVPLAVIDVWEHAYYIDYRNKRRAYVEAVFDKLIDWGAVGDKLAAAEASATPAKT